MTDTKVERKQTLRDWRDELGLTQAEVAELVGVSHTYISQLELGQTPIWGEGGNRVARALGLELHQLVPSADQVKDYGVWVDDGYALDAPKQTLQWWRERRGLSQVALSLLAGFGRSYIHNLEDGFSRTSHRGKAKIAQALRVSPDKLIFPGDEAVPSNDKTLESILRAELRGARNALRRAFDFLREDPNIAFRSLEQRDKVLEVVLRELRGE